MHETASLLKRVSTTCVKGRRLQILLCGSRKYSIPHPHPWRKGFLVCTPYLHPSENSNLVPYLSIKIFAFATPLPTGIFIDLSWGEVCKYFFCNCTENFSTLCYLLLLCSLSVHQVRWTSRLIDTLEPHLKTLVKQHGEITEKLSATEVLFNLELV